MCLELLAQKLMFCVSLSVFLRGNMLRSSAHKMKKKGFSNSLQQKTTFVSTSKNSKTCRTWCKSGFIWSRNWPSLGGPDLWNQIFDHFFAWNDNKINICFHDKQPFSCKFYNRSFFRKKGWSYSWKKTIVTAVDILNYLDTCPTWGLSLISDF